MTPCLAAYSWAPAFVMKFCSLQVSPSHKTCTQKVKYAMYSGHQCFNVHVSMLASDSIFRNDFCAQYKLKYWLTYLHKMTILHTNSAMYIFPSRLQLLRVIRYALLLSLFTPFVYLSSSTFISPQNLATPSFHSPHFSNHLNLTKWTPLNKCEILNLCKTSSILTWLPVPVIYFLKTLQMLSPPSSNCH